MNRQVRFFSAILAFAQCAFAWEPRSPRDCRLAFLVGYSSFTGDAPSLSVLPPASSLSYSHFERIARAYAEDIGVPAEMLDRGGWREKVAESLAKHYKPGSSHKTVEELFGAATQQDTDLAAAYLAGAYSQHGTSTGFRLVNQRKGLYLAWLIRSAYADLPIDATLKPGIPGNITITLRDGGQQTVQGFIEDLEAVRAALSIRK
jgi:hypothetical protein